MNVDNHYDVYALPEDYILRQGKINHKEKDAKLCQPYEEAKAKHDQFVTAVDQGEAAQTERSTFQIGALDKEQPVDDFE